MMGHVVFVRCSPVMCTDRDITCRGTWPATAGWLDDDEPERDPVSQFLGIHPRQAQGMGDVSYLFVVLVVVVYGSTCS